MSSQPLGIALIGCGTVGGGVAKILLDHRERLTGRAGRPLILRRVIVATSPKDEPFHSNTGWKPGPPKLEPTQPSRLPTPP